MFDTTLTLDCAGRPLKLDLPRICGVLNLTADSFSGDGLRDDVRAAVGRGLEMVEEGADLLDVGGESTRPGAQPVTVEEEIARVVPVIEALVGETDVPISIDTSRPEVMLAAVAAGAGLINDVYGLRREGALEAAADLRVPGGVMHMQGEPRTMQDDPHYYQDVVGEVHRFLAERVFACEMAGIDKRRVLVDPGFGFGKTLEHNLALLRALDRFRDLGAGVFVGLSRKSMLGAITGRDPRCRATASAVAALMAVQRGAMIVRVHDVSATRDALAVWRAVHESDTPTRAAPQPFGSQRFDDD